MSFVALRRGMAASAVVVGGVVADLEETMARRPRLNDLFTALDRAYAEAPQAWMQKRSAVHWAEDFDPQVPILLLHGSNDWRANAAQSLAMGEALNGNQHPYRLLIFEGGEHSLESRREEVFGQIQRWLDLYLRDGVAPPPIDTAPRD